MYVHIFIYVASILNILSRRLTSFYAIFHGHCLLVFEVKGLTNKLVILVYMQLSL